MKGGETWNCSMNDETRYFNLGKNILTSTNMNFRILIMTFLKHARMTIYIILFQTHCNLRKTV